MEKDNGVSGGKIKIVRNDNSNQINNGANDP
jgi:hypothetical protein